MKHRGTGILAACALLACCLQSGGAFASEGKKLRENAAAWNMEEAPDEDVPAEIGTSAGEDKIMTFPRAGISIEFPAEVSEIMGVLSASGGAEMERGCGVTYVCLDYCAMPEEDYRKISENEDASLWDTIKMLKRTARFFTVYGVDGGRDFSAVNAYMGDLLEEDRAQELAKAGEYTFYLYTEPYPNIFGDESNYKKAAGEEFFGEYRRLLRLLTEAVKRAEFFEPEPTYLNTDGAVMRFETMDLDGNPVDSEELFARHEITVVNLWASWCGPCINELQELEKINGRISELDCAVIGILTDGDTEKARKKAEKILQEKGVTYTVLMPPENLGDFFAGGSIPATYFVGRNGEILGDEIRGAYVDRYEKTLKEYLAER